MTNKELELKVMKNENRLLELNEFLNTETKFMSLNEVPQAQLNKIIELYDHLYQAYKCEAELKQMSND
jgi:hypothetical protein